MDEDLNPLFLVVDVVARMKAISGARYFLFSKFFTSKRKTWTFSMNYPMQTVRNVLKFYLFKPLVQTAQRIVGLRSNDQTLDKTEDESRCPL